MLHGVFIGIDHYEDQTIPALRYARRDARRVHDAFARITGSERTLHRLLDDEATRESVMTTIGDRLSREVEQGDVVVLYFAGHGTREVGARLDRASRYLVPYDAHMSRIFAAGIDMEHDLGVWLKRLARAKLVLLFLDSCFCGAAGGRSFLAPLLKSRREAHLSASISIKHLNLGEGHIIMCASDENQPAQEDSALEHGVFTHYLLDSLQRPRDKPAIHVTTLYEEVAAAVAAHTQNRQEAVVSMIANKSAKLPSLRRESATI